MPTLDLVIEAKPSDTLRARQLCGMFDVPPAQKLSRTWRASIPIDERPWNVGLIVGPSGAGKTQCARSLFGAAVDHPVTWGSTGVIDDFREDLGIEEIAAACQAVGFSTIPSWLRPYGMLSNGERFRVELARRLLEAPDPVVVDEFTSVVDRQVAQIGSHAVQKWARREKRRFVAVTCHFDVVDWLQPDWVFEPAQCLFTWRSLQRRPQLPGAITRVPHSAWRSFAPFHYLTAALHRSAKCFGLFVDGRIASFAGLLPRAVSSGRSKGTAIWGVSRLVTLPDFQGLGLAFVLGDRLGAMAKDLGSRLRVYPAHPPLIRSYDRSPHWQLIKQPGRMTHVSSKRLQGLTRGAFVTNTGGRPNAVFEYVGPSAGDPRASRALWLGALDDSSTRASRRPKRKRG